MSDDSGIVIPVIAGLAVGIALIVIFSSFTKPTFTMSDEEIRVKLMTLPEVQAFEEKAGYEHIPPVEKIWHEGSYTYAEYSIQKSPSLDNQQDLYRDDLTKELRLLVKLDSLGGKYLEMECAGQISVSWRATVEGIKTTECLENP